MGFEFSFCCRQNENRYTLASECRICPKLDDPLATTEAPSAMPKEFEPLDDWLGIIDAKKEDEREILLNLPDQPEITGGK